MTHPVVNALPQAPARLSRPSLFFPESTVFLDALPTYREDVNQFSFYLNSKIVSKYNYGLINGKRDFPNITQSLLTDVVYEGVSISFVSDLDSVYFLLQENSQIASEVGEWLDEVILETGVIPYDTSKPLVSGIVQPMYRGQSVSDFNNSAVAFNSSAIENLNAIYLSVWYTYQIACGNEDYGSVSDNTIIYTNDYGSITDATIIY